MAPHQSVHGPRHDLLLVGLVMMPVAGPVDAEGQNASRRVRNFGRMEDL